MEETSGIWPVAFQVFVCPFEVFDILSRCKGVFELTIHATGMMVLTL